MLMNAEPFFHSIFRLFSFDTRIIEPTIGLANDGALRNIR